MYSKIVACIKLPDLWLLSTCLCNGKEGNSLNGKIPFSGQALPVSKARTKMRVSSVQELSDEYCKIKMNI